MNATTTAKLPNPKLSKSDERCIGFAHACRLYNLDPVDCARLCNLARRAAAAGVHECSVPDHDASPARRRFALLAESLGLRVEWPGLYPSLYRGTAEVRLPL